jgi:putative sterol carrier protein
MRSSLAELVEALAARSRSYRLPAALDGVVRLEVADGDRTEEHWLLRVQKGVVTVVREEGEPDLVLRGDAATFTAVLSGRANMMAALLRGALEYEGSALLLVVLQRLTPGETGSADAPVAGHARRRP